MKTVQWRPKPNALTMPDDPVRTADYDTL
ncbi:MAG: hypothetical protein CDV28_1581, partial [Candidatus Electronema aureum]